MQKTTSKIPYNYKTIKITQSRLNKGLLAVPVSLIDYFPKQKGKIYVATGINDRVSAKVFTPYTSSSRECRIGGMRDFYEKFNLKDGDEIVVQLLDTNKYRILTEKQFEDIVKGTEKEFDESESEAVASSKLETISKVVNITPKETLWSEYSRLTKMEIQERKQKIVKSRGTKESAPPSIRKLLTEIYDGKCQITGFGFLMKNWKPYFEVHHIKPELGNHIKNILVVSPNIHTQFTYAFVKEFFDNDGWLRQVKFNDKMFVVNHIIDKIPKKFEKEVHFET
jgi:predicted restriction endonuclease